MRVVIAPDSFKGSLPASEVAAATALGVKDIFPTADTVLVPLADGGEGTVEALVAATGGRRVTQEVTGPMGRPVTAHFGVLGDGKTAVVEMASASGLPLVDPGDRNPMVATTYGTGELIKGALDQGCRRFIIGIGGSATNDGGVGMAQALGVGLVDETGEQIPFGALGLERLARVDLSTLDPRLAGAEVLVACDVDNPLTGPRGAAHVYGPQKGADREMVRELDRLLGRFALILREQLGKDVENLPGAGAAGGLGAGLVAFLNAQLGPGVDLVLEAVQMEKIFQAGADLVITGEGVVNGQTIYGKAPIGVARLAGKYGIPVVGLVGGIGPGAEVVYDGGICALATIVPGPMTLDEAMEGAFPLVREGAARVMRLVALGQGLGKCNSHSGHRCRCE